MPFGQSIPVSSPVAAIAGFVGGEACRYVAEKMGCSESVLRLVTDLGHAASSAGAGYVINAIGGADVTGAVVTTAQTAGTVVVHDAIHEVVTQVGQGSQLEHPPLFRLLFER